MRLRPCGRRGSAAAGRPGAGAGQGGDDPSGRVGGWRCYDLFEVDERPDPAPARSPGEACISNLGPLTPPRRRRRTDPVDDRDYRGELMEAHSTLGELAEAGERALLDAGFPGPLIDQVDRLLEEYGLELRPADEAEAA